MGLTPPALPRNASANSILSAAEKFSHEEAHLRRGRFVVGGASLAVQAAPGGSKPWNVLLTTQGFTTATSTPNPTAPVNWKLGIGVTPSADYMKVWDTSTLSLAASYGATYSFDTGNTFDSNWAQSASFDAKSSITSARGAWRLMTTSSFFQNASQVLMGRPAGSRVTNISQRWQGQHGHRAGARVGASRLVTRTSFTGTRRTSMPPPLIASRITARWTSSISSARRLWRWSVVRLAILTTTATRARSSPESVGPLNPTRTSAIPDLLRLRWVPAQLHPGLTTSLKAGAQIQDWVNDSSVPDLGQSLPRLQLSYAYDVGSKAQFGVIHRANTTDVIGFNPENPVLNQESTAFYANITHAITRQALGLGDGHLSGLAVRGRHVEWGH